MSVSTRSCISGGVAGLTGEEQKAVKTTAFDLRVNPAAPGLQFHRLVPGGSDLIWEASVRG
jgi:hypothetical protein